MGRRCAGELGGERTRVADASSRRRRRAAGSGAISVPAQRERAAQAASTEGSGRPPSAAKQARK